MQMQSQKEYISLNLQQFGSIPESRVVFDEEAGHSTSQQTDESLDTALTPTPILSEQPPKPKFLSRAARRTQSNTYVMRLGKIWLFNSGDKWNVCFVAMWLIMTTFYFNNYIAPYAKEVLPLATPLVYAAMVLNICFAYSFIMSVITEPGVIPKGNVINDPNPPKKDPAVSNNRSTTANNAAEAEAEEDISIDFANQGNSFIEKIGHNLPISFYTQRHCKTCKIIRPPKASHCPRCNHCVKGFDHHCYFIGNCVGARNYKYFVYFLVSMTALGSVWMGLSAFAVKDLFDKTPNFASQIDEYPILKYGFYGLIFLWIYGLMCGMHRTIRSIVQVFLLIDLTLIGFMCHDADKEFYMTPLCPLLFFLFNAPIASMVFPMSFTYLFNTSRKMTVKEKSQLDAKLKDQKFSYYNTQSIGTTFKNLLEFVFQRQIPSEVS